MEQLLSELASTSPQRTSVLDAVQKLDSLRQHINNTQELLSNVDTMICACEQMQQKDSQSSRTELLQRELGRLNSRLCCTVLALERAMSKAICRGTQSGVRVDLCCASGIKKPQSDAAVTVHSEPAATLGKQTTSQRTVGVCEEWLNSQQAQPVEQDVACKTGSTCSCTTASEHVTSERTHSARAVDVDKTTAGSVICDDVNAKQVSLQEIHRMLGDIITDIDQPPPPEQADRQQTILADNDVDDASNRSLMTDSVVASFTDLRPAEQTTSNQQLSETQHDAVFDDDVSGVSH